MFALLKMAHINKNSDIYHENIKNVEDFFYRGLDFRADYISVGVLQSPVQALTAIATKDILEDVIKILGLSNTNTISYLSNRYTQVIFDDNPMMCLLSPLMPLTVTTVHQNVNLKGMS